MNYLEEILHCYSPTFAALAPLWEIILISVAALQPCVLRGALFLPNFAAFAPLRETSYFGCGFASAVSLRNSIFLAPLGGVKLNS